MSIQNPISFEQKFDKPMVLKTYEVLYDYWAISKIRVSKFLLINSHLRS